MNRQFKSGLQQFFGEPDPAIPDDLVRLAEALESRLAAEEPSPAGEAAQQRDPDPR